MEYWRRTHFWRRLYSVQVHSFEAQYYLDLQEHYVNHLVTICKFLLFWSLKRGIKYLGHTTSSRSGQDLFRLQKSKESDFRGLQATITGKYVFIFYFYCVCILLDHLLLVCFNSDIIWMGYILLSLRCSRKCAIIGNLSQGSWQPLSDVWSSLHQTVGICFISWLKCLTKTIWCSWLETWLNKLNDLSFVWIVGSAEAQVLT